MSIPEQRMKFSWKLFQRVDCDSMERTHCEVSMLKLVEEACLVRWLDGGFVANAHRQGMFGATEYSSSQHAQPSTIRQTNYRTSWEILGDSRSWYVKFVSLWAKRAELRWCQWRKTAVEILWCTGSVCKTETFIMRWGNGVRGVNHNLYKHFNKKIFRILKLSKHDLKKAYISIKI